MKEKLEDLLRNKLRIGSYPDELSETNDGHKIFVSAEDLYNLNNDKLDELIALLNEIKNENEDDK